MGHSVIIHSWVSNVTHTDFVGNSKIALIKVCHSTANWINIEGNYSEKSLGFCMISWCTSAKIYFTYSYSLHNMLILGFIYNNQMFNPYNFNK